MSVVKVSKWSFYDLGDVYRFAANSGYTYLRLIFVFSNTDEESMKCMEENSIKFQKLNEHENYFTSDMTYFPKYLIDKLMDCIHEEIEALFNSHVDDKVMKSYLDWFLRNVDSREAIYIPIELNTEEMVVDLINKNGKPIKEIYELLEQNNPFVDKIAKMYKEYILDIKTAD